MSKRDEHLARQFEDAREEGYEEGLKRGRQEILDWLEAEYIGPGAPDRNSPEAATILELAREAGAFIRGNVERGIG